MSETDENGFVTVSLVVKNAEFQVIQGTVYYDSENFSLDDESLYEIEWGKPVQTALRKPLLTVVKTNHNPENGTLEFALMSNLGYSADEFMSERHRVLADENGIEIFSLKLKKIGDGDYNIGIENENPELNRLALACAGEELAIKIVTKLPDKEEQVEVFEPVVNEPEKTYEQQREERMKDLLILQISNYAAVDDGNLCWIDSENKAVMPYIKNQRTMIPLRFVAERLGLTVEWEQETQKIIMKNEVSELVMQIGNVSYTKDGEIFEMDAAPELTDAGRTFVPLRAIAEAFGQSVSWIEKQNSVIIVPDDRPWDETNTVEQRLLQDALLIMSPLIRDLK